MQRFFTAVLTTASLAILQTTTQAQSAANLMIEAPVLDQPQPIEISEMPQLAEASLIEIDSSDVNFSPI